MPSEQVVIKLTARPVRLSYPALFEARAFQGADGNISKPAFSATFLLDKAANAIDIKAIQAGIEKVKASQWPGKKLTVKTCLHDGSEKADTDGYGEGVMYVSARSDKRPGVVDRDLSPLTAEDGKPYAGCYVFATIRLWAQDNQWGKRINASLRNVQFIKDGDPFGEKPVAPDEDFTPVEDGEGVV